MHNTNNFDDDCDNAYLTGKQLLNQFHCYTREQRLECAVKALMAELNDLHTEYKNQDLLENLTNKDVFCSCADAYRMGHEALKA